MMQMKNIAALLMLMLGMVLVGCDKLEDSDMTAETLPGKWSFNYHTSEELPYVLAYQFVVFNADGTCALTYSDGQLEGTYRASNAVIRIETTTDDGQERTLLWKVLSMSPYKIVAEYTHRFNNDREVTMTVTLDKV